MNLALQHWPQRCPIGLNVITQVVAVVAHVNGHAVINLSRSLVPQRSWIPIVANRSVRGVPNLNLLPRPAVATQHRLSLAELLHGNLVLPLRRPHDRPRHMHPRVLRLEERVVILVGIHGSVPAKINRVGIQRPCPAKKIGIKHLRRQGLPSSGRSSRQHTRIRFRYHPKVRFEIRNHLFHQRIAIRSVVHRVHRVRIVVILRRMLKRHCDHSRKILRIPRLIKLVSRLTVQVRQRRPQFRRNGPVLGRESEGRLKTEMVLFVNRRIARVGMLEQRSEEHTSELQSPIDISYAVFCLKKKKKKKNKKKKEKIIKKKKTKKKTKKKKK